MTRKRQIPVHLSINSLDSPKRQKQGRSNTLHKQVACEFPSVLVRYLENISKEQPEDEEILDVLVDRALEECQSKEELLLHFVDGCFAVEGVFLKSVKAAFSFLKRLDQYKKTQRLQLIFNKSAQRVLERLLQKMVPFKEEHQDVISNWIEVIIDNWADCVASQSGAYMIRAMCKALCGLNTSKATQNNFAAADTSSFSENKNPLNGWVKTELDKIIARAFDYKSMKDLLTVPSVSMILQELTQLEVMSHTGRVQQFAVNYITETDNLFASFAHRDSSRLWENIMHCVDEQVLESLFAGFISDAFSELAMHPVANYPLKAFLEACKSEKIAQEIVDQFIELLPDLLNTNKSWIVVPVLKMVRNYPMQQESLVKTLRKQFTAEKRSTKKQFLPNVLCLNRACAVEQANGQLSFDINNCQVHGSYILNELFNFKKNKAILISLSALTPGTLIKLSENPVGSHVFDGFFGSSTVDQDTKLRIMDHLKMKNLVMDKYGSRVFEQFWFAANWDEVYRKRVMEDVFLPLVYEQTKNQYARILLRKLNVREFRENPKSWLKNLENNVLQVRSQIQQQRLEKTSKKTISKTGPGR